MSTVTSTHLSAGILLVLCSDLLSGSASFSTHSSSSSSLEDPEEPLCFFFFFLLFFSFLSFLDFFDFWKILNYCIKLNTKVNWANDNTVEHNDDLINKISLRWLYWHILDLVHEQLFYLHFCARFQSERRGRVTSMSFLLSFAWKGEEQNCDINSWVMVIKCR